jgi:DNA (cytosine-5)-methyltransferase 1
VDALRIGSLFSGYGGLDMAIEGLFGASTAWHCQYDPEDPHQFAAAVLAHHYPGVPNLGDITRVDWDQVPPVDILTGGFPCTDVSLAGTRAGLNGRTRSGLWAHMARAIDVLRPNLVVIENVRGLLSQPADGDVERCTWCVGDGADEPVLRALGAVLADLAGLGFDAEWLGLPASAVGAAHERFRVFILAWPAVAHPDGPRLEIRPVEPPRPQQQTTQRGGSDGPRAGLGGAYAPALDRWARIIGCPPPRPVDAVGRLSPELAEWLMGVPGWLTSVPAPAGMTDAELHAAQVKAAGNGVVPHQARVAVAELWRRANAAQPAAPVAA